MVEYQTLQYLLCAGCCHFKAKIILIALDKATIFAEMYPHFLFMLQTHRLKITVILYEQYAQSLEKLS